MNRILIDECLSRHLVTVAKVRGLEATHVLYLGKAGWQDCNLMDIIAEGDYLFVTQNGGDFRKLYGAQDLHNGLVVVIPKATLDRQVVLFEAVLDFVTTLGETANRLIEVHSATDIRLSNLPPEE